ncbi:pilus assembly protein [Paramagnetospirillum kuznetsovii]|uniref:Pilus assembly protein n=1 Tax=Paramagnetospirillum kuznetsovii TaxID=2053833 RepID=A0A364NVM9_9PROT|nr:TadE/TadG family type IV pilus assembly protein [Paramagnetospirillum kuznetsovii]RAU21141.1 pilus assembly protein [Paramagnetospirillum kuznetsovii]
MMRRLSSLGRHTDGLAAIEFAVVMPMMLIALLGTVEISNLVNSYSKTVSASQTVADLTSQSQSLTTTDLNSIVIAAQRVLDPLISDATTLGIDVVSIGFDAGNHPVQLWHYAWGMTQATALSGAQGLGVAGESVVMVTLSYKCVPLIHDIVPQKVFKEVSYSRPRLVRKIAYNGVTG